MSDEKQLQNIPETSTIEDEKNVSGTGFEMSPEDPRSVNQRGGLEAVIERSTEKLPYEPSAKDLEPAADGTTGGDFDPKYVGAGSDGANTTTSGSGIVNLDTSVELGSTSQTPGVGPSESIIGTQAVQVEMTDVGLVDVAATNISLTGDDENNASGGARVEDQSGQPL